MFNSIERKANAPVFFLLTCIVLIDEDLPRVLLVKYRSHNVEECKLISFLGLKSGKPKHLLFFCSPYYKAFIKWPAISHARRFWSLSREEHVIKEEHRIWVVAVEPETMLMFVQIKLSELNKWNKFTKFLAPFLAENSVICRPPTGWVCWFLSVPRHSSYENSQQQPKMK